MVKLRKQGGVMAAVVMLLAAGLMLACFAAGEGSYGPLSSLPAAQAPAGAGHAAREGQVNINAAATEELETLPGIGAVKAAAIAAWRMEHGPFRCPEELSLVPGMSEGRLEDILDQITAGGEWNAENSGGR